MIRFISFLRPVWIYKIPKVKLQWSNSSIHSIRSMQTKSAPKKVPYLKLNSASRKKSTQEEFCFYQQSSL